MNGPTIGFFGEIIRNALAGYDPGQVAHQELNANFGLYLGQIQAVYTVDSSGNTVTGKPGTFTLYDVLVYRHNGTTELVPKCRAGQPLFGGLANNFMEVTPPALPTDATDYSKSFNLKEAPLVIVGLLGGQKQAGVILCAFPSANPLAVQNRPKAADGAVTEGEFQGLRFKINNDGELVVTLNGPRDLKGNPVSDAGPTTMTFDKTGAFKVTTKSGCSVVVDEANDQIVATDKEGGKLRLSGGKVALGSSAAELLDLFDQFLNEVQKETHVCLGPGFQGTPPVNTPKYAAIQTKLKQIKGSLG